MKKTARRKRARSPAETASRDGIQNIVNGVRRLSRGLRIAARNVERETGMSAAQLFVLEQLDREPAMSIRELAARTMTDRSSVSVIIDRLAARRLVSRVTASDDRRRAEVRITAAGRNVLERAPTPPTELLINSLKSLTPSTARRLEASLRALNTALGFEEAGLLFED